MMPKVLRTTGLANDPSSRKKRSHCFFCVATSILSVVLWVTDGAHAAAVQEMINEAVQIYSEALNTEVSELRTERFRRAQRLFHQAIVDAEVANADLYANLGNAALQCEQLGQAILAYRRALAIEPGHRRAIKNLDHARLMLPDWVPRPSGQTLLDTFFIWHQTLSRGGRDLVASLCFAACAVLVFVAIGWKRTWARNLAVLPMLLWFALLVPGVWSQWDAASDAAVVTAVEVIGRSADSAGAPRRFAEALPGGTEVDVLERRAGWARIRLANNRDAWVRASSLTSIISKPSAFLPRRKLVSWTGNEQEVVQAGVPHCAWRDPVWPGEGWINLELQIKNVCAEFRLAFNPRPLRVG